MKLLTPKTLKNLRLIHRYLSFLCSGILMIYLLSGFLLNHQREFKFMRQKVEKTVDVQPEILAGVDFESQDDIKALMSELSCDSSDYKKHRISKDKVSIQGKNQLSIVIDLEKKTAEIKQIHRPPFLTALNTLHHNPGKIWTYTSDVCLILLITVVITGLLIVPGKKGIAGIGGVLLIIGILIPLIIFFILQ